MNAQNYRLLLSKFSHEIRNPVALISSFLQLLRREHPEIASSLYYRNIQENMGLLRQLLDDMSHFNNADRLHREPTDLCRLLREAASSAAAVLSERNISLRLDLPEALPVLSLDRNKIRQGFL